MVGPGGCVAPSAPGNARILSMTDRTVTLGWDAASGNPATYLVEAGTTSGSANLVNLDLRTTATSLTAQAVPAVVYYVRLRAANACGGGPPSNELIVTVP